MSLVITSPLQKSIPALTSSMPEQDWEKVITIFIDAHQHETLQLLKRLDTNIQILEHQKDRASELISILEEAGGLTVRARNLMSTPEEIQKYQKNIKEFEEWFKIVCEKFDAASKDSVTQNINLMNGDRLETFFDEKGQNKIVTEGIPLTCAELGIRKSDFTTLYSLQNSRIDVMNAIDIVVTVRNTISAHISTLTISHDFALQTIELSKTSQTNLKHSNLAMETAGLKKLNDLGYQIFEDEQMADEIQQELLNSFTVSPNMEDI